MLHDAQAGDVTQRVLDILDTKSPFHTSEDLATTSQKDTKAALDRLASRLMVSYETKDSEQVLLTPEAEDIVAKGSHEFRVWAAVKEAGKVPIKELPVWTCSATVPTINH